MPGSVMSGGFLSGKKTYITAILGILAAVGAYLMGGMNLVEMLQTAVPLAAVGFLRAGVSNS